MVITHAGPAESRRIIDAVCTVPAGCQRRRHSAGHARHTQPPASTSVRPPSSPFLRPLLSEPHLRLYEPLPPQRRVSLELDAVVAAEGLQLVLLAQQVCGDGGGEVCRNRGEAVCVRACVLAVDGAEGRWQGRQRSAESGKTPRQLGVSPELL
jgi:hypothetical protein